jgi:polysaccharide pyruvyl transferase WcaK-like protein
MNVLLDSCSYTCQNVGDLAMLTVAVSRLRELWPSARIQVLTSAPQLVARHCGAVETVPVEGRRQFLAEHLLGRADRWIPGDTWRRMEESLRFRRPELFNTSAGLKQRLRRGADARRPSDLEAFVGAIRSADLVVVNGAGILNDSFPDHALGILATIDLAVRRGVPAALVGQGIGPIDSPALRRRAAEVLPRAALIAVRESQASVPILASLGVDRSRILVTGDDAIELALARATLRDSSAPRPLSPVARGVKVEAIGVNVRVASYAGVNAAMLAPLKDALASAAAAHEARLVGIPIAHHGGGMDVDTLRGLVEGDEDASALDTPRAVIDRVGECRVVVTGSYHGAVFALAQGIPAVALIKSPYYAAKMAGVADQFGCGCELVSLDRPDLPSALRAAIDRGWESAERVREPLLRAAADQVRRGRAAYARLAGETGETGDGGFGVNGRIHGDTEENGDETEQSGWSSLAGGAKPPSVRLKPSLRER